MKQSAYGFFKKLFSVTMLAFMVLGFIMILFQLFGIVSQNPKLILWSNNTFKNPAMYISCITGFAGYFAHYLKPKKK